MDHPSAAQLSSVPLLSDLPPDVLMELADWFDVEEFPGGRTVLSEGRAGYAFYILQAGRVSVRRGAEVLRELAPGDFFGEIAIIGDGRRTASVVTLEPVTTWTLFGTAFRQLQQERPAVAVALNDAMADRLARG